MVPVSLCCRAEWVTIPDDDTTSTSSHLDRPGPSVSVAAVMTALEPWKRAHSYTLTILATAVVRLQGGFKHHFSESSPRLIVFHISTLPRLQHHLAGGNPAEGFYVFDVESWTKDALQELTPESSWTGRWESWMSLCRDVEAIFRKQPATGDALVGVLPSVFFIYGAPVLSITPIAIRHWPLTNRGEALCAEDRALFEDVMHICMYSTAAGLVLQPPLIPFGRLPPQAGIMVQRKKRDWDWLAARNFWERDPSGCAAIPPPQWIPQSELQTGLDVTEICARFLYGNPASVRGRGDTATG
ncbi:hypothetical protein VTO73DRAFT_14332 [Trametes versicolor]